MTIEQFKEKLNNMSKEEIEKTYQNQTQQLKDIVKDCEKKISHLKKFKKACIKELNIRA
jgi:hypothetical protein